MPITNLSKINTWEDLAWMDIIFLSPLPLLLPPLSIVLSLKRLVYGDVAITLNVNAGLSAVPCMCVCDSNGAKAQSHSPSRPGGKTALWSVITGRTDQPLPDAVFFESAGLSTHKSSLCCVLIHLQSCWWSCFFFLSELPGSPAHFI